MMLGYNGAETGVTGRGMRGGSGHGTDGKRLAAAVPEPEYQENQEGQEDDPARDMFTDNGKLNSGRAQYLDDLMEAAALYASGELDDPDARLDEASLARIGNPALRAKLQGKIAQARQAEELRAHQQEWDRQMHRIGGAEYSGAQLHSMHEYLKDERNADTFEKELMAREGISREEAKKRRANVQEYLDIAEKERRGQPLSEEEERRKRELEKTPSFGKDFRTLSEKVVKIEANGYGYTSDAKQTGQMQQKTDGGLQLSTSNGQVTARQIIGSGFVDTVKPPSRPDYGDIESPLIRAESLKPAFQRAESSVIPLDTGIEKKPAPAPVIVASAPVRQAEGATF